MSGVLSVSNVLVGGGIGDGASFGRSTSNSKCVEEKAREAKNLGKEKRKEKGAQGFPL